MQSYKDVNEKEQIEVMANDKAYKKGYIKGNIDGMLFACEETAKEILSRLWCYGDRDEALRRHLIEIADDYEVEVGK